MRSPYLTPLFACNAGLRLPFIIIEYDTVLTQLITQPTNFGGIRIPTRTSSKNYHSKESYAFCISILNIHLGETPFLQYPLTNSWLIITLSCNILPGTKAGWLGCTRSSITACSLCEHFLHDFIHGGATRYRPILLNIGRVFYLKNKCDNSLVHRAIHAICLEKV